MRTCQSCGRENPPDQDFCQCGEYLRWEPTGLVEAITPEMAEAAAAAAPPAAPAEPAQPAAPGSRPRACPQPPQVPRRRRRRPPPARRQRPATAARRRRRGTAVQGAVPGAPMAAAAARRAARGRSPRRSRCACPTRSPRRARRSRSACTPATAPACARSCATRAGIVDNYQLHVDGLPAEWYSVLPDTVYLVPYGSGGTYEQEVEIHFHPPRVAEAEARIVGARRSSRTPRRTRSPRRPRRWLLVIQPFEEHKTKVKPERASGRRKADFKIAVENKANAPVYVAFDAAEPDNECSLPTSARRAPRSRRARPRRRTMRVRPPKQMWIGRPHERRIEVNVKSGEEAHEFEAARAEAAEPRPAAAGCAASSRPAWRRASTSRRSTRATCTSAPAACRCPSRWSAARRWPAGACTA